jgi:lipopolysaccharide transport system ATP-binding protein
MLQIRKGASMWLSYSTRMPLCEGNYALQLELTKPLIFDQSAEFLDVIDNAVVFRMARRPNGRIWAQMYIPNALEVFET